MAWMIWKLLIYIYLSGLLLTGCTMAWHTLIVPSSYFEDKEWYLFPVVWPYIWWLYSKYGRKR